MERKGVLVSFYPSEDMLAPQDGANKHKEREVNE